MNDIIRIHIAGVPYNCEADARILLIDYIDRLKSICDNDVIADIEIRITELFAEQGIIKESVITTESVESIKKVLGTPRDFIAIEGVDNGTLSTDPQNGQSEPGAHRDNTIIRRRLYRDPTSMLLSGVCGGVAQYTGMPVAVVRALIVLLTLLTSGFVVLIYIALWIFTPIAKTSAQRLEMRGERATISTIDSLRREQINDDDLHIIARRKEQRTAVIRVLQLIGGAISILAAISALIMTILAIFAMSDLQDGGWYVASFGLAIISGVLLSLLFIIISFVCFKGKITPKAGIVSLAIICLGLLSFGLAVAGYSYSDTIVRRQLQANTKTVTINALSTEQLRRIKSININNQGYGDVNYVVSSQPKIETTSYQPINPVVTLKNGVLQINLTIKDTSPYIRFENGLRPNITIYGPALESMTVTGDGVSRYEGSNSELNSSQFQSRFAVITSQKAVVSLERMKIAQLNVKINGQSAVDASLSDIAMLEGSVDAGSSLSAGTIETMRLTTASTCASDSLAAITIDGTTDDSKKSSEDKQTPVIINGEIMTKSPTRFACYTYVNYQKEGEND